MAYLDVLPKSDGSAAYSRNGFSIICGVNGPVEVQRRDELPDEAAVDVVVRPAAGVGGVRERHLESILQNTLRHVILVTAHPRTLIQVTLQVVAAPVENSSVGGLSQAVSNIQILPALLQTSILALLSSSIPISMTLTSTSIVISSTGELVQDPSPKDIQAALSLHILAFSSRGDLLLAESEGEFDIQTWEAVVERAREICWGVDTKNSDEVDITFDSAEEGSLQHTLRSTMEEKMVKDQRWKD